MFITLFILVLSSTSIDIEKLTEQYLSSIENKTEVAESVWALNRLYFSADSTHRSLILNKVDNDMIRRALVENNRESESVQEMNEHFISEELLLYLLLNQREQSDREQLFNKFYQSSDKTSLKELNQYAVRGEKIPYNFFEVEKFGFEFFLAQYYYPFIDISNSDFNRDFGKYWVDEFSNHQPKGLREDLHLVSVFNSLYAEREFQEIKKIYDSLLSTQFLPPSVLTRDLYWDLEFSMYQIGLMDRSLEVLRKYLIPTVNHLGNQQIIQRINSTYGAYLFLIGRYDEAKEVFLSALDQEGELSNNDLTRLYNNLSLVFFETGESSKYIETQLKALGLAQSTNNLEHQLNIYRNLHLFHFKNRNWETAYDYLSQAEEIAEVNELYDQLISVYTFKAALMSETTNNFNEVLNLLNAAESLISNDTDVRTYVRVLFEKANYLQRNNQLQESKQVLSEILSTRGGELITPVYLEISLKIANIDFRLNNIEDVKNRLQEFKAHDISVVSFPVLVLSKTLEAKIHQLEGDFKRAGETFDAVTEITLERARNSADFESGYWSIEPEYLDLFESYADFLIGQNRLEEAVSLLDQVKTINDASILENPLIIANRLSEEELTRQRQLTEEMDSIRRRLFTTSGSAQLELQTRLERLSAERNELINIADAKNQPSQIPIWSLQRQLSSNEMIYHITEINDSYYLSTIYRDKIDVQKKEITDSTSDMLESAVQSIVSGKTNLEYLYKAGELLELGSLSPAISSIIVLPDGYFHQLPLDVIPLQQPDSPHSFGSSRFLIEQADVRALNRLSDLRENRVNSTFTYDFSGFGISDFQNSRTNRNLISLPNAPIEVASISTKLNRFKNNRTLLESEATTNTFKQVAGNSKILHMASHSEISESDPLFSRLHLSPGDDANDVHIFAYELFDLDLQNELIMLNSCDSGGGRFLQGSGIMGISRALRYAGAGSLVLNGWSVNDQFAADFADQFYRYLNKGETKSRALQLAKIYFIEEKNADPHYWGPYILNGNNEPILQKREANIGNWFLLLLFAGGLMVLSSNRNKFLKE